MNESSRNFLIFVFLIYILSAPTNTEERYPSYINKDYILDQYHKEVNTSRLAVLNNYEEGYGNITGFKLSYQDSINGRNASLWPFPDKSTFRETQEYSILSDDISLKASEIWNLEGRVVDGGKAGSKVNNGVFPLNITGVLKGQFNLNTDLELNPIPMSIPNYLKDLYDYREKQRNERSQPDPQDDTTDSLLIADQITTHKVGNVTDSIGEIRLNIINTPNNVVNDTDAVGISLKFTSDDGRNEHKLNFHGIYHQDGGNLVMATESSKFQGLYGLPHLNLGPGDLFNRTKYTLLDSLNHTEISDVKMGVVESFVDAVEECEYIGYFHFESTNLTRSQIIDIDRELSSPLGRPHKPLPNLKISKGLLYSPDCGIVIEMSDLEGTRNEIYKDNLKEIVLIAIGLVFIQLMLFIRQMARSNTPSALAKLSFWTLMIMNTVDSGTCIISLIFSLLITELYLQFAMLSFFAFTFSALYEMKYAIQIYCIQLNERPLDWRTMLRGTPLDEREDQLQDSGNQVQQDESTEPTTATIAPPNILPAAGPIDGNEQSIGAEIYSRNFFFMLVLIFIFLNVVTWPKAPRRVVEYIAILIFNSYWVPQIYRNTLRGSRTSFSWEFIVGISITRFIPFIYIELLPNAFSHHRDPILTVILLVWLTIQIGILYLQEQYGPRFFLNDNYLPPTYDYHPLISRSDLKDFHIDENSVIGNDNRWITDCAICMQKVEIPLDGHDSGSETFEQSDNLESGGRSSGGRRLLKRRKYMITPCHHVFHTDCLENWMMYKLQCPNCRSSIPPF